MKIFVLEGDITKMDVDAIVNPANSFGFMGGGVALAIKRAGGEEIEREAVKKAPIPVGKAVVTTGGRLNCKVIHAPTMVRPGRTSIDNVRRATGAAIRAAIEKGFKSIAIPGMGTGVGRVDYNEAAKAMIEEIRELAAQFDIKVYLVDLDDKMVEAWRNHL